MPDSVGVAVIGLDHWYSAFMILDEIVGTDSVHLIGIADVDPQRLEEARQKYRPEVAEQDYRALLEDESIELVFSFVPTADNAPVCLESIGRGKHTLCVKPPAMTVADANLLAAAAEDSGVVFSATETLPRFSERNRLIKELIGGGEIGVPISFYHVAHGGLPQPWPGKTGDSWWLDPAKAPGGAWLDHAIYAVDHVRWTLEREVETVSGTIANRIHVGLKMEDYGLAWLRMAGGFTAVMEDTWTAVSGTRFDRWIGTEGSLFPDGDEIVVSRRSGLVRHSIPAETGSSVANIAGALRGRGRLPFKHTCSVANLAACLAFYESANTGRLAVPTVGAL